MAPLRASSSVNSYITDAVTMSSETTENFRVPVAVVEVPQDEENRHNGLC